jgi:hypothetical protein
MRSTRRVVRGTVAIGLSLAACGAAPAGAEPITELSMGAQPSAVTDAAGTLHVVWRQFQVPGHLLYCRVPAGGGPCAPVQLAQNVAGAPYLFVRPQDGALIAVFPVVDEALGGDATGIVVSADGGTTWSGQASVGAGLPDINDAKLSLDGSFVDTVAFSGDTVLFQRVPVAGAPETRLVLLGEKHDVRVPRVTHLPDGRPAVIAHFAEQRLGSRVEVPGADVNVATSWSPFTAWRLLPHGDASAADVGPTGSWLLATDEHRTSAGTLPVRIWRWDAHGFEHPRTIGALARRANQDVGGSQDTNLVALDVDLAGRLHAAWPLGKGACGGQTCIVYRRTDRNGFGPPIIYPLGPALGDVMQRFTVAANAGGSGWLVWSDLSDRIRAVPLVTPPLGSRVGSKRIGRRRVTVPDFYGCVPTGGRFVHRLDVDGRRGAQIVSVRFFFDAGQPARTDHRAPWRLTFTLPFAPGTRHVASAIVHYRLPGRRTVRSVRIGRTFVMC